MTVSSLAQRIEGSPHTRILREFATNSALFPVFDAIRVLATEGLSAYLVEVPHYLVFISAGVQAWFLGRRTRYTWWERALGNLIAPALYSVFDILLEGPAEFAGQPYHWVFWVFSSGMALLSTLGSVARYTNTVIIVLTNLWRVMLFPALYALSELTGELSGSVTWGALITYWYSSSGHGFILLASVLFGLMLGLSDSQLHRYTDFLRRVSRRLKEYSEWLLDPVLVEESLDNASALQQRRVERTILFVDIRGFTQWSEDKDPELVVSMLNQLYEMAESVIVAGEGHKPHFIGDEVMTWFDEPMAAIETVRRLKREASALLMQYGLALGGGLHIGEIVEGLMGSSTTRSYNILGDTVNTASRLCSAAQPGEILISADLAARLALASQLGESRTIEAKGKQQPIAVYVL